VANLEDARQTAEDLAGLIESALTSFIEPHASLQALIEEWRSIGGSEEAKLVPATLAAAGRDDEARAALDGFRTSNDALAASRDYQIFARRLLRWLDHGDELPDPGDVPSAFGLRMDRSLWPSVAESVSQGQRERAAIKAVRARGAQLTREQRRTLLVEEAASRQLSPAPLWYEQALDSLEDPQDLISTTRRTIEGLGSLARWAGALRQRAHAPTTVPAWASPPPEAAYRPQIVSKSYVAVDLDPAALPLLQRARETLAYVPGSGGTALVDVWLDWANDGSGESRSLAVHIGDTLVGTVHDVDAIDQLSVLMDLAARRDELPVVTGRLRSVRSTPRLLLELPLPPTAR
jgi:hypothetical protein